MDEEPYVRGLVGAPRVRDVGGVRHLAVLAVVGPSGTDAFWYVRGMLTKIAQQVIADVHAPVEHL